MIKRSVYTVSVQTYVKRLVDRILPELLAGLPAVSLVGARACGKTTTALRYARSLARLNREDDAALFRADPDAALALMERPTVLDEWQEVPEVLDAVKQHVDTSAMPGEFILTGSVSAVTRKMWAGTGRVTPLPMYPLTRREIDGDDGSELFVDKVARGHFDLSMPTPPATIVDYMSMAAQGGLPEYVMKPPGRARDAWLRGYITDLTSREIASVGGNSDITKLRAYVSALAAVSGCVVDDTTLLNSVSIDRRTSSRYEALLEAVFYSEQIPAWRSNRLARLAAKPKRFILDTAVLMAVLRVDQGTVLLDAQLLGRILETFVAMQLRAELPVSQTQPSLCHLRDHGGRHEVDFILEYSQGRLVGLEVKASASPQITDARHLMWLRDNTGDDFVCGIVLHTGRHSFRLSDRIYALPISAIWAKMV